MEEISREKNIKLLEWLKKLVLNVLLLRRLLMSLLLVLFLFFNYSILARITYIILYTYIYMRSLLFSFNINTSIEDGSTVD